MMVDVDKIIPNPQQPRTFFDEDAIASLASSLAIEGLLNPISIVGPVEGVYIIEDGERRWRAAKRNGWKQIEASVKVPQGASDVSLIVRALVGNLLREDLGPVDEALAYEKLTVLGMTVATIAERVGRSPSNVSSRLRLLQLAPEVQELFNWGKLPLQEQVMGLLRKMPEEAQVKLARRAAAMKMDAGRIAAMCTRMMNASPRTSSKQMARALRSEDMPAISMNPKVAGVTDEAIVDAVRAECKSCGMFDDLKLCRSCPLQRMIERLTKGDGDGKQ